MHKFHFAGPSDITDLKDLALPPSPNLLQDEQSQPVSAPQPAGIRRARQRRKRSLNRKVQGMRRNMTVANKCKEIKKSNMPRHVVHDFFLYNTMKAWSWIHY